MCLCERVHVNISKVNLMPFKVYSCGPSCVRAKHPEPTLCRSNMFFLYLFNPSFDHTMEAVAFVVAHTLLFLLLLSYLLLQLFLLLTAIISSTPSGEYRRLVT